MHIFLTGDVQVGKSTIIKKTLAALQLQGVGGFRSVLGKLFGIQEVELFA